MLSSTDVANPNKPASTVTKTNQPNATSNQCITGSSVLMFTYVQQTLTHLLPYYGPKHLAVCLYWSISQAAVCKVLQPLSIPTLLKGKRRH